jgi:hypothetical protein
MRIDTQIVVECVGSIVNSIRTTGTIQIVEDGKSTLETCKSVMYDCGCLNEKDLKIGEYKYTIIDPHYIFGNKFEVQRIFNKKTTAQVSKYPVVILEQPFIEVPKEIGTEATIRLLFASFIPKSENAGNPIYKKSYKERFKKTLYPLYNSFVKEMKKSQIVKSYKITSKVDRPLFNETKLLTSEYWDVIDVKIKITFSKSCQIEVCEGLIYGN